MLGENSGENKFTRANRGWSCDLRSSSTTGLTRNVERVEGSEVSSVQIENKVHGFLMSGTEYSTVDCEADVVQIS